MRAGQRPSARRRAALRVLRAALDGVAWTLLLVARLSIQLAGACLRMLLPSIGSASAIKRAGRIG